MKIPVEQLYTLEGEAGPAMDRIKQGVDWLLSPAAKGEGKQLLEAIYARFKQPLNIIVTDAHPNMCINVMGRPTVLINPRDIDMMKISDGAGKLVEVSPRRVIAHEWGHAADPNSNGYLSYKIHNRERAATEKYLDTLTEQEMTAIFEHVWNAEKEPFHELAKQHIKKYLDSFSLHKPAIAQYLEKDKIYQQLIKKRETRAMIAENRVAWIDGEPLRKSYGKKKNGKDYTLSPKYEEITAEYGFRDLVEKYAANKPKIAEFARNQGAPIPMAPSTDSKDFWQNPVKNPTSLKLSKWEGNPTEHPLIAQHKPGGIE